MTGIRVLVVGAGPAGLLTALFLRKHGIEVDVIDQNQPSDAKSFAVVLHPRSIALLSDLGITEPLLWHGHSFKRVVVYSENERRALLELLAPNALAEGGLTLPQNVLRHALERTLCAAGVEVRYRTRLVSAEQDSKEVRATLAVEAPGERGTSVPAATLTLAADFMVGADGWDSSVRAALGIDMVDRSPPETYAFFDVPDDADTGVDVQLIIGALCSGVYPLHGQMSRYAFELSSGSSPTLDDDLFRYLKSSRMPWRAAEPQAVEWSGTRQFRRAVVERFGAGRIWLVGDAGHSTNPLGVQSLNVGLREAKQLASQLVECAQGAPVDQLSEHYGAQRKLEWRRLMGEDAPSSSPRSPAWASRHFERLLACLPASGDDLDDLLAQLGLAVL